MEIEFNDIICINFIERCDGEVLSTNIEKVARDSGVYNEKYRYIPTVMNVGSDTFVEGLYSGLVQMEVGAKGTIIIPPKLAYGEKSSEMVHSVHKKMFKKAPKIGDLVFVPEYGDGTVVHRVGSQFIIDCNHPLAGKEIEYEYEILEKIIDPAEQFSRLVGRLLLCKYETSFENGNGIISVTVPTKDIKGWNKQRILLACTLFERHPSLDTLEFHEEYDNVFHTGVLGEAAHAIESDEIKIGDVIIFNFIERCDGEVLKTTIERVARDNALYDEEYEYIPDFLTIGLKPTLGILESEVIGKKAGAKGTVLLPPEKTYGLRSNENVHSIDRKEISKNAQVGSHIHHPTYGDGIVVKKIGKRFVVDFNNVLAGKNIECEYEILEVITDPAEKFYRLVFKLAPEWCNASFENGKGVIALELPLIAISEWNEVKIDLALDLFVYLPTIQTLEFREKYVKEIPKEELDLLISNE